MIAPSIKKLPFCPIDLSDTKLTSISNPTQLFPTSLSPPTTLTSLIVKLLESGANLEADMRLYLKSLLFGSLHNDPLLTWLVSETVVQNLQRLPVSQVCLYYLAALGYHDPLETLCKKFAVDPNGLNGLALCVACRDGRVEVVRVLVRYGATGSIRESMPLALARKGGFVEIVGLLEGTMKG
jgi:hypothetical protein